MECYIIEPFPTDGRCLGITERGKVSHKIVDWTIPQLATRFSRKEDAEDMAKILLPNHKTVAILHIFN